MVVNNNIFIATHPLTTTTTPFPDSVILNDVDERHWEWNSYGSAMANLSSNDDDDVGLDGMVSCGCNPTDAVMIDMQQHQQH